MLFRAFFSRLIGAAMLVLPSVPGMVRIAVAAESSAPSLPANLPPALDTLFGGPFSLVDQHGNRRTDTDFRGKYMLIFFGYTYCPTICPTNLGHMAWALEALGDQAAEIQPIFVTIDPERDTPDLLGAYVASFDDRIVALSGSEAEIAAIAKAYRVHRVKVLPEGSDADDYLVDHSSITYLMDPDGKFVTLFPHNTAGDVMAARIGGYLSQ